MLVSIMLCPVGGYHDFDLRSTDECEKCLLHVGLDRMPETEDSESRQRHVAEKGRV